MEKKIRFGIALPQEGVDWDTLKRHWQEADRLGYDHAWFPDHILTVALPHGHPQPDSWTCMAAIAEATKQIRIGALVTCYAFRNPALLANAAATIDQISKGRLEFAVGAGWFEQEFEAYGYEFPRPGVRLAQLEEAIQVYQTIWTQQNANFQGKYFRVKDLADSPKPVQQPYPRFWIGGGGEQKTLRLVAKYADVWNATGSTLEVAAHKLEVLKRHCRDIGRDFSEITLTRYGSVFIDDDEERVWSRLRKRAEQRNQSLSSMTANMLVGTPEQVGVKLRQFTDLGFTEFIFLFGRVADLRSTQLFAEKVFPMFDHPVGRPARA